MKAIWLDAEIGVYRIILALLPMSADPAVATQTALLTGYVS